MQLLLLFNVLAIIFRLHSRFVVVWLARRCRRGIFVLRCIWAGREFMAPKATHRTDSVHRHLDGEIEAVVFHLKSRWQGLRLVQMDEHFTPHADDVDKTRVSACSGWNRTNTSNQFAVEPQCSRYLTFGNTRRELTQNQFGWLLRLLRWHHKRMCLEVGFTDGDSLFDDGEGVVFRQQVDVHAAITASSDRNNSARVDVVSNCLQIADLLGPGQGDECDTALRCCSALVPFRCKFRVIDSRQR